MKHEIIKTENYLLVVDESEIKEGDLVWAYDSSHNDNANVDDIGKVISIDVTVKVKPKHRVQPYVRFSKKEVCKILAHLPLNNAPILEGVPLLPPLEQDDDVEKLARSQYSSEPDDYEEIWYVGFIEGYNKCRKKYKWSDEDVIKIVEKSRDTGLTAEFLILSFSQLKMPISFECEYDEINWGGVVQGIRKTFTNFKGQTQWVGKYIY